MLPALRSLLFYAGIAAATLIYAPISWLVYPLPYVPRYRIITQWTRFALWWLKITCNLTHTVTGSEHIPPGPAIILCKHQSAWETMAVQTIFPPLVFVLKRELLRIPLFGWGLAALDPIAIDRGSGVKAARRIVEQGAERLGRGLSVVVFPEGTRTAPGQPGRYQPGGGMLAEKTGLPVVPVAHNAGRYWPRNSFTKRSGIIRVVIGPPIASAGKTAKQITEEAADWIEATAKELAAVE